MQLEAVRATLPGGGSSAPLSGTVPAGACVRLVAPPILRSAFVSLCTGETRAASGSLHVLGELPAALGRAGLLRLRRRLGVFTQPHGLLSNQTLRSNLQVVLAYGSTDGSRPRHPVHRALEEWGLTAWADTRPGDVPQDACFRAALLRAVIRSPECLIADRDALVRAQSRDLDLITLCRRAASTLILLAGEADDPLGGSADAVLEWQQEIYLMHLEPV